MKSFITRSLSTATCKGRNCQTSKEMRYLSNASKNSGTKPDWMIEAEREARAAQGHKTNTLSSRENTVMDSLQHEMKSESVSNTSRVQSVLERQLNDLKVMKTDTVAQKVAFDELRNKALQTRNQLITQREAAGFTQENSNVIESMYPIPKKAT